MESFKTYNLYNKVFKDNICNSWKKLQNEEEFCDVTLVCEGNQVKAHKVVLAASSQYFKNILMSYPHPHPLLYLHGVKNLQLVYILTFMYTGEVAVPLDQVLDFIEVVQDFKIKGLAEDEFKTDQILDQISSFLENEIDRKSKTGQSDYSMKKEDIFKMEFSEVHIKTLLNAESKKIKLTNAVKSNKKKIVAKGQIIDNALFEGKVTQTAMPDQSITKDILDEMNTSIASTGVNDMPKYKEGLFKEKTRNEKNLNQNSCYPCDECNRIFKGKFNLYQHMGLVHKQDRNSVHLCDHCPKKYTNLPALKKHLSKIHGAVMKKVKLNCNKCSYETKECVLETKCFEYLSYHIKVAHDQL